MGLKAFPQRSLHAKCAAPECSDATNRRRGSIGCAGLAALLAFLTPELAAALFARTVDAGSYHTCAVDATGAVRCWGGYGTSEDLSDVLPSDIPCHSEWIRRRGSDCRRWRVSHMRPHGCRCGIVLGQNDFGQLGDGTTTDHLTPVAVVGLASGIQAIAVGFSPVQLAITAAGGVRCWGYNADGTRQRHAGWPEHAGRRHGAHQWCPGNQRRWRAHLRGYHRRSPEIDDTPKLE